MKKIFFLTAIVTACNLSAQSFATENINNYNNKTYRVMYAMSRAELTLKPDETYTAKYESEGLYWFNSGTYEQRKDIIQLFVGDCREYGETGDKMDCAKTLGNALIELIFDNTSLYYTQFIKVISDNNKELLPFGSEKNSFTMGVPGMEVPAGESRKIDGKDVITMASKVGVTTSEVKIRKTPDVKGEAIVYVAGYYDEQSYKAVPINTEVVVVARTPQKVKVQNWENYWYYVNVGTHYGVWMYGEFVRFQ